MHTYIATYIHIYICMQVERLVDSGSRSVALYRCSIAHEEKVEFVGGFFENVTVGDHWAKAPRSLKAYYQKKKARLFKYVGHKDGPIKFEDVAIILCKVNLVRCDNFGEYYEIDNEDYKYVSARLKKLVEESTKKRKRK